MTRYRIQNLRAFREEVKAVARGERPPQAEAATMSFNSVASLMRLLTPENRRLLAVIRERQPQSIAELADLTGRAAPNVTRTLAKLAAAGFVTNIPNGFKLMINLIQSVPTMMMGKPVIKGTRITVESVLEKLAAGETIEQILDAHPRLTRESILAALAFAAQALRADVVYPITEKVA